MPAPDPARPEKSSFVFRSNDLTRPKQADFFGVLTNPRTQSSRGPVDTGDDPIAQRRPCVSNPRRSCGDSERSDAAIIERGQPRDTGIILADTRIIENRRKAFGPQGLFRIPSDKSAMRARDDDGADIFRGDQRGRVDQDHGADLALTGEWGARFRRFGRNRGWAEGGSFQQQRRRGAAYARYHTASSGKSIGSVDGAAGHHVVSVADSGADMRNGRRRFALSLQKVERGDTSAVSADTGIVENRRTCLRCQHQVAGVKAAVRARHNDSSGDVSRKNSNARRKYGIH